MKRLSVVITNHNYERFVGAAIDSALSVRWPDVEVVVVDDGSTDGSRAVIESYGGRIRFLATENATQRVAANRGFALSTGDVVVFLDSDDVLPDDLALRVSEVWGPSVSKVQGQMQRIDVAGTPMGDPFPAFRPPPTAQDVRRWLRRTSAYPTPPGSGNVYARWFLDQILPVGEEIGDFADSAPLAAAPFFGDVVSVPGLLVGYRQHGGNDSNLLVDVTRFPREVARARARWRWARTAAGDGNVDEGPLFRSRELLQLRVASCRLVPDARPLPDDRRARMFVDALRSPRQPGPEPLLHRLVIAGWSLATLVAPPGVARALVARRYRRRA